MPLSKGQAQLPFMDRKLVQKNSQVRMSSVRENRIEMNLHGNSIGFLDYRFEQKRDGSRHMYIADVESPIYTNAGIATRLIKAAIWIAKINNTLYSKQKLSFVQADVDENNEQIIRILKKIGFSRAGYAHSGDYNEPKMWHYRYSL